MADASPPGTANIVVSVTVQTRAPDGTWSVEAPDPSAPIMIGDTVRVHADVWNAGPDAATVTVRLSESGIDGGLSTWMPSGSIWDSATCGPLAALPDWCTFTIPAGNHWTISPGVLGRFPGTAGITFTATTTDSDPDPSDNTATWRAPVTCQVTGTPGDDTLVAGPGQAACGDGGDDTLIADPGALVLAGGDGNDTFVIGRATQVHVSGGAGTDTASYANARNPIMVCPSTPFPGMWSGGMASPEDGGATMWGVENVIGSPFDDRILGNGSDNVISGGGGSDWIGGGGGEDVLRGGPGADLFRTTDRARDVVSGGVGHDRADVDRSDHVTSATDVGAPPYHDPCLG